MTDPTRRDGQDLVLREAIALLDTFFTSKQPFFTSNDSFRGLLQTFGGRLQQAHSSEEALALIRRWRSNAPRTQGIAMAEAQRVQLAEAGQLTILTERDAKRIAGLCPDGPAFA